LLAALGVVAAVGLGACHGPGVQGTDGGGDDGGAADGARDLAPGPDLGITGDAGTGDLDGGGDAVDAPPLLPPAPPWEDPPSSGVQPAQAACLAWVPPRGTDMTSTAARADGLALIGELGISRVRWDFVWAEIEPTTAGTYDFSGYDPAVADLVAAGVSSTGILLYGNGLYDSSGNAQDPPDSPAPYGAYAQATAAHFAGQVDTWELWNEPNVGFRFFPPTADPERYAALALAGAAGVRQGCPSCTVITAGLIPRRQLVDTSIDGTTFLQRALAAPAPADGLGAAVDGFGWHPYTLYPPCAAPEYAGVTACGLDGPHGPMETPIVTQVAQLRAVIDADPGARGKPVHFTEMGWPSYGSVDPDTQADFLVRGMLLGASVDARSLCWYTLYEGPNPTTFPPEDAFGLVTQAGERKPAFAALKSLVSTLGAAVFARDAAAELGLDAAGGENALLFLAAGRAVTVLWHATGEADVVVPLRADSSVQLTDRDGTDLPVTPGHDRVQLHLSASPLYLVENR
jgi:hypothetical protein